jgi:hypothetical protein
MPIAGDESTPNFTTSVLTIPGHGRLVTDSVEHNAQKTGKLSLQPGKILVFENRVQLLDHEFANHTCTAVRFAVEGIFTLSSVFGNFGFKSLTGTHQQLFVRQRFSQVRAFG